jgi:nucleotidyltransferase substrate binding protein (TIGR01987 family)
MRASAQSSSTAPKREKNWLRNIRIFPFVRWGEGPPEPGNQSGISCVAPNASFASGEDRNVALTYFHMPDIRWKQRLNNYTKAFQTLDAAVELARARELSELEKQGLIQSFEFTHELAWNVLKDYLEWKGIFGLIGSRDATRAAFKNGLIEDGEAWMQMIDDRNKTSHSYDQQVAEAVMGDILERFHTAFQKMAKKFAALHDSEP